MSESSGTNKKIIIGVVSIAAVCTYEIILSGGRLLYTQPNSREQIQASKQRDNNKSAQESKKG